MLIQRALVRRGPALPSAGPALPDGCWSCATLLLLVLGIDFSAIALARRSFSSGIGISGPMPPRLMDLDVYFGVDFALNFVGYGVDFAVAFVDFSSGFCVDFRGH